ncbi:MAG: GHKL domain-containing protein [Salinivirgaceae bacterium]|nr:GHKL domain-containing protein [Salinivirgaceae bacterium]
MKYKHFYRAILTRIAFIALLSGLASYLFFTKNNLPLSILVAVIVIILIINTIRYFNNINRWIAFFLLGIENEDTTLKIPKKTGSKAIDDVFEGMERLNDLFKKTKIEISTQEQYYKSVINQSATGLFSVNEQGRIININPAAEKLTGLAHYHHINSLSKIDKTLPNIIVDAEVSQKAVSTIFENTKGQKLLFRVTEIKTTQSIIKLIAVSDITKELDNREIDAWVKLARTLSHEIMNNITPITTLSQVILNYFKPNNEIADISTIDQKIVNNTVKGLEVIEERSSGLMKFVDNYRKFTKLPDPQLKDTNLSELLEKTILAASTYSGFNKIQLEKIIPKNIFILADENLLSQVLINLVKNGIEALQECQPDHQAVLDIKLREDSERTTIEICNNGPLIPPEIREQIFIPFFTTKENGSGIGLSLSKQIMLKMNGDIQLKSDDEKQITCFRILI